MKLCFIYNNSWEILKLYSRQGLEDREEIIYAAGLGVTHDGKRLFIGKKKRKKVYVQ